MMTTRLMNVLVALLLVAGQLASSVHLASNVTPEPASEFAVGQSFDGQLTHDHQTYDNAANVQSHVHHHAHFHAHRVSIAASLQDKPPEKNHDAGNCALCHLASHLLAVIYRASALPQPLVADKVFVPVAEHTLAQAFTTAHAIRGPPGPSLI